MIEQALHALTLHTLWKTKGLPVDDEPTPEEIRYKEVLVEQRESLLEKLLEFAIGTQSNTAEGVKRAVRYASPGSVGRLTNSSINRRSSTSSIFMFCLPPPTPSHLTALLYLRQHLRYLSTMKLSIAAQAISRRKLSDMLNCWTMTTGRTVVMRTVVMIMRSTRSKSRQRKRRKLLTIVRTHFHSFQTID
jgi:hypothetical protein